MKYKYKMHENGHYDIFDVPIFAVNERKMPDGSVVKWSKKDLQKLADLAQAKESRGIMPPVFVGHNGTYRGDQGSEDSCGSLCNIRCMDITGLDGKAKTHLVANMCGLDSYTFERIKTERLTGRSVEVHKGQMRLTGLALLGRRAPHLEMPNESVKEHSENYELQHFELYDEGHYGMNPAPAAPAPAATPAPAAPAAQSGVAGQLLPLLQQMMQILQGGAAPAAPAPAPTPAPAAAKPQNFEAETPAEAAPAAPVVDKSEDVLKYEARIEYLEASLAAASAVSAQTVEVNAKISRDNALEALKRDGKVVNVALFDNMTQKFGLDYAVEVASAVPSAPTSTNAPRASETAQAEVEVTDAPSPEPQSEGLTRYELEADEIWNSLDENDPIRAHFGNDKLKFRAVNSRAKL